MVDFTGEQEFEFYFMKTASYVIPETQEFVQSQVASPIELSVTPPNMKISGGAQLPPMMINVQAKLKNSYLMKQEEERKQGLSSQKKEVFNHLLIGRIKDT